jgi:hypothetical protein
MFWEHDVFDETGFFLRNLVGLAAVAIERTGTRLGEDVPGDEAAGDRGIPFRQSDIEDAEFGFTFLGDYPSCPGLPDTRPKPGECTPTPDGDFSHQYQAGGANPFGAQFPYKYIPGPNSIPNGGSCADAVAGTTHNWNYSEFLTCKGSGEMVVTCNASTTTPYQQGSCGWGSPGNIALYLYSVGGSGLNLQDGCEGLVQDVMNSNLGDGYMGAGSEFTFTTEVRVHGAGTYSLLSMPGCDTGGTGTNTGFADWTVDFP